jgi:hypothetical protein
VQVRVDVQGFRPLDPTAPAEFDRSAFAGIASANDGVSE